MASSVKFISTINERLSQIEVKQGQLIFVSDTHKIYMDIDGVRAEYGQIIELQTEQSRLNYLTPIRGFYFVIETKILWRYDSEWVQLTSPPKESIVFTKYAELPVKGELEVLYITETDTYYWGGESYIKLGEMVWKMI